MNPTFNPDCRRCPRLSAFLDSVRLVEPYIIVGLCRPSATPARIVIVGLAPGMHGANRTGRPFTGDHAGILLYRTLYKFGLASGRSPQLRMTALSFRTCASPFGEVPAARQQAAAARDQGM